MKKFHYLFHILTYYVAWFAGIKLAACGDVWLSSFIVIALTSLQIGWQYKIQHNTRGLWCLIGLIVFVSTLIDSLFVSNGLIVYAANPFSPILTPPWMIAIWISFAVILYATLSRFFNYLVLLGFFSFAGFAFAYFVGAKMGAAFFPHGDKTCFLIGAVWLIFLPLTVYCYKKIMGLK